MMLSSERLVFYGLCCASAAATASAFSCLPNKRCSPPKGTQLQAVDPSVVNDFVNSLDGVLGNPTRTANDVAAVAGTATNGPDLTILVAGGLATLSIGGLVALQMGDNNDESNESNVEGREANDVLAGSMVEKAVVSESQTKLANAEAELMAVTKENDDLRDKYKSEQVRRQEATEELAQTQTKLQETTANAKETKSQLESQLGSAETGQSKLQEELKIANDEISSKGAQVGKERSLRKEVQAKLFAVTKANSNLWNKYRTKKTQLKETSEELASTQTELTDLQKQSQEELAAAAEVNRQLEDQYELEQNEKNTKIRELKQTEDQLVMTRKQFAKTQMELSQTKQELFSTQSRLEWNEKRKSELEAESRSIRKLTKKILSESKNRVTNRFRRNKD